jgi:hypothetical protein
MNADALGDAGTPRCQANDPMQLARTRMLPAVAGTQIRGIAMQKRMALTYLSAVSTVGAAAW